MLFGCFLDQSACCCVHRPPFLSRASSCASTSGLDSKSGASLSLAFLQIDMHEDIAICASGEVLVLFWSTSLLGGAPFSCYRSYDAGGVAPKSKCLYSFLVLVLLSVIEFNGKQSLRLAMSKKRCCIALCRTIVFSLSLIR